MRQPASSIEVKKVYSRIISIGLSFIIVFIVMVLTVRSWSDSNTSESERRRAKWVYIEERRLIQYASCKSIKSKQSHSTGQTQYEEERKKHWDERNTGVQHALDLQGLRRDVYESYQSEFISNNEDILKEIELGQSIGLVKALAFCLKTRAEAQPDRSEQYKKLTSKLENEIRKFSPREELQELTEAIFWKLLISWWELKLGTIREMDTLSTSDADYPDDRYFLIEKYRRKLKEFFSAYKTNPKEFSEFRRSNEESLASYLKSQPELEMRWKQIMAKVSFSMPWFSEDQTGEKTGMVLGALFEENTGKPLAGIKLKLWRNPKLADATPLVLASFQSDDKGRYVLPALPEGDYTLSAELLLLGERISYTAFERDFYIQSPEEILMIDFPMERVEVTIRPSQEQQPRE